MRLQPLLLRAIRPEISLFNAHTYCDTGDPWYRTQLMCVCVLLKSTKQIIIAADSIGHLNYLIISMSDISIIPHTQHLGFCFKTNLFEQNYHIRENY